MNYIKILDYGKLISLIFDAKKRVFFSLPGIDEELASALIKRKYELDIKVVIDNSEESIRNGYGEIKAIDMLCDAGISLNECNGNLVSFIIADNDGYFLFPQSRIFSSEPHGSNAIKIDPVTIQLLILHYFSSGHVSIETISEHSKAISESINHFQENFEEIKVHGTHIQSNDFDEKKYNDIKKKLEINPPLEPDLRRNINTYAAKIQFVELKFAGGNLENKIANLPKNAIPINSNNLKQLLLTRIKMFGDISNNKEYKEFQDFKKEVEKLREDYLKPITCRQNKSIIQIDKKKSFKTELEKLQNKSKNLNETLLEMLEKERLKTKDLVKNELTAFFEINPPDEVINFKDIKVKRARMNEIIDNIVASIKFPDVKKLIENISIKVFFYDLTWTDFSDDTLLKEFAQKKIMDEMDIKSILDLKKVFAVKK